VWGPAGRAGWGKEATRKGLRGTKGAAQRLVGGNRGGGGNGAAVKDGQLVKAALYAACKHQAIGWFHVHAVAEQQQSDVPKCGLQLLCSHSHNTCHPLR